jgi:site-specific DNA-methyltransferase (adenine-specific)
MEDGGSDRTVASAARFFYCAKASRKEREMGMDGQPDGPPMRWNKAGKWTNDTTPAKNNHPTVKPLALMRYLCRLVTPPGGLILDPFMGSGTTLIAAGQEGFRAVGIEVSEEYCEIARKRIYGTLGAEIKESR